MAARTPRERGRKSTAHRPPPGPRISKPTHIPILRLKYGLSSRRRRKYSRNGSQSGSCGSGWRARTAATMSRRRGGEVLPAREEGEVRARAMGLAHARLDVPGVAWQQHDHVRQPPCRKPVRDVALIGKDAALHLAVVVKEVGIEEAGRTGERQGGQGRDEAQRALDVGELGEALAAGELGVSGGRIAVARGEPRGAGALEGEHVD